MRSGGRRFRGVAGRDYRLFISARPHYPLMQRLVGRAAGRAASESPGKAVRAIEIGCGQGDTSREILRSSRRIRLVGVDNEPLMLKAARKALGKYRRRARVVRSDALAFLERLPPSSADIMASAFTLHNFTKAYRSSVHRQIFRVLRPGGVFINADKFAVDGRAEHKAALEWQLARFRLFSEQGRPDLEAAWRKHYLDDESPSRLMRASQAVRELERIGFRRVRLSHRRHLEALLTARKATSRRRTGRR